MKLLVTFRQPGRGFYKMYLSPSELLRFSKGRARREPASKDGIISSIPIKYITSIRIVGAKESTCSCCEKPSKPLLCVKCIDKIFKRKPKTKKG